MPSISGTVRDSSIQSDISVQSTESKQSSLIGEQTENTVKDLSEMGKLEKVEAQSSGNKAIRVLTGLLGGMLLLAGVAAATVATVASFGLAAGVLGTVAAFVGVTGASIASGVAGCAGIALIATSAMLAPKHPDAASENKAVGNQPAFEYKNDEIIATVKNGTDNIREGNSVSYDDDSIPKLNREINTYRLNIKHLQNSQTEVFFKIINVEGNLRKMQDLNSEGSDKDFSGACVNLVDNILEKAQIGSRELTKENVLTVRLAIFDALFNYAQKDNFPLFRSKLSDAASQKAFANDLLGLMDKLDEKDQRSMAILIAALTFEDITQLEDHNRDFNLHTENLLA